MAIVTGDRYLESLVKFVEKQAGPLIEGTLVLKLNPVGLHYVQSRLEALAELESLLAGAPVDYLRAYVSDLGDHRALEQLRRILRPLPSLKVISVLPPTVRDPTPLSLLPFGRLKVLELRGCDLSTSAARGLLELRHTLEKIICHNSTDALRHVFASRIADIKDSPAWNQLSFVSCACNGLVLMDESLQLLPALETLDLSRNKFTKVDNIRRCVKLKHLDLGFNHLKSIVAFRQVSCKIVKLVLRNNALVTLRGIENLKSLEGLDLSFNIISNFLELEVLAGLPSLCSLWLEGNPVCCASWYRAQVFSFTSDPYKLKLDEEYISTREFWKRQFIIANRQKQPASFGFYSPARDEAEFEGTIKAKRKKASRLACVASEEQSTVEGLDNEARSKHEKADADEAPEVVDLMNKIEFMKRERSILWLDDFREWMNQAPKDLVERDRNSGLVYPGKENYSRNKAKQNNYGETSTYVSDSFQTSENPFYDYSTNSDSLQYLDQVDETAAKISIGQTEKSLTFIGRTDPSQGYIKSQHDNQAKPTKAQNADIDVALPGVQRVNVKSSATTLAGIDEIILSRSSSGHAGAPPHYEEDILHRRQNLEEEFLQLSAGSYSVASSESDTSDSDDDSTELGTSIRNHLMIDDLSERSVDDSSFEVDNKHPYRDRRHDNSESEKSDMYPLDPSSGQAFENMEVKVREPVPQSCGMIPAGAHDGDIIHLMEQEVDLLQHGKSKTKHIKRVISLKMGKSCDIVDGMSSTSIGNLDGCEDDEQGAEGGQVSQGSDFKFLLTRSITGRGHSQPQETMRPMSFLVYKHHLLKQANSL